MIKINTNELGNFPSSTIDQSMARKSNKMHKIYSQSLGRVSRSNIPQARKAGGHTSNRNIHRPEHISSSVIYKNSKLAPTLNSRNNLQAKASNSGLHINQGVLQTIDNSCSIDHMTDEDEDMVQIGGRTAERAPKDQSQSISNILGTENLKEKSSARQKFNN